MSDRPAITPEMIALYDAYTHVTLDRRGLVAGLARLAGGSVAGFAALSLIEASAAKAAIVPEDDARLITAGIGWVGDDDQPMTGYMARLKTTRAKLPAVLVIHENRGLNAHIRDVARRLALEGFVAVAPDFLSPAGGTPADEDKARALIGALDRPKAIAHGVATLRYLSKNFVPASGRVGAVGFCWGGGMVNQLAVSAGNLLRAGVAYYGPAPVAAEVPKIKASMLLHYAGNDARINEGLPAYRAALEAAKVRHAVHVYEGAEHAFNNDTSAARYDKPAADLAWDRTVAFLRANLV